MPARLRAAERQPRDRAHVVFKLAGLGALDGPVTGVMDARRHLVGDEPAAFDEIFDAEDTRVAERAEQATMVTLGRSLQPRIHVGRARDGEDAVRVLVFDERVALDAARTVADGDQRHLAREIDEAFIDERPSAEALEGLSGVARPPDSCLAFAVITEATRLQDAGRSEGLDRARKVGSAVDRGKRRDGNTEAPEN